MIYFWNFEFGLLGFICDLFFGAWNLIKTGCPAIQKPAIFLSPAKRK